MATMHQPAQDACISHLGSSIGLWARLQPLTNINNEHDNNNNNNNNHNDSEHNNDNTPNNNNDKQNSSNNDIEGSWSRSLQVITSPRSRALGSFGASAATGRLWNPGKRPWPWDPRQGLILLMIELLHDLIYQNSRNYGSNYSI